MTPARFTAGVRAGTSSGTRTGNPASDAVPWLAEGRGIDRIVAATEAQLEVWLADRVATDASLAFNESITLCFSGVVDTAALGMALDALLTRHEALRSTVGADGSEFIVASAVNQAWSVVRHPALHATTGDTAEPNPDRLDNGSAPPLAAQDLPEAVQAARRRAVDTPFDLTTGPLFRAELHCLGDTAAALILSAHHLVCDGWSWGVVVQDLADLYAEALGVAPSPEPVASFADFAQWSAEESRGPARREAEAYWISQFDAGTAPVLELPTDHGRPRQRSYASHRVDRRWTARRMASVTALARQTGRSVHATLFTSFAVWLARLTEQDDLVIGVPWASQVAYAGADRHPADARPGHLVGHGVHLLPVRCAVDRLASFSAQVQQTGTVLLDALDHAGLTYGALLRKLQIPRDASRPTLVSVMFNLDTPLDVADRFEGLCTTLSSNPRSHENYEIFANLVPLADGGMQVEVQAQTALFSARTIENWLDAWETLLDAASAMADVPVGELPWLSRTALGSLQALHGLRTDVVRGHPTQHAAVLEQVARTPDRVACRYGDETLSYRALGARSAQVARALRACGIGRGDRVGICLPRSIDLLVSVLGVLRTGAAYVPLDPDFPSARLAYMASDAELAMLITQAGVATAPRHWRTDAASRILELDATGIDDDIQVLAGLDTRAGGLMATTGSGHATRLDTGIDPAIDGEDPAYVLYTSGSTGQPKGVVVPHRAVANFLASMALRPGLSEGDRLAAVTTLSFDIAVLEWWLPLSLGAVCLLVPRDTVMDGDALRQLLDSEDATVMQATPGVWRMLIDAGWKGHGRFVALVGGEPVPVDLAEALLDRCSAVWNLYGPTETTVWSTTWRVDRTALRAGGMAGGMSIGTPIHHTDCWVLDAQLQPVPIGVPGELWIGGRGVASGYHGKDALTAERFIDDPFRTPSQGSPCKLYRTGDRARWRQDGRLEHLGRQDLQVKVRGYRIELGEIEAACLADPAVLDAAVATTTDASGDVRIVAYLVASRGGAAAADALPAQVAALVAERLPTYMHPQHWVLLPELPRLPNGKVDRRSLPAPTLPAFAVLASRTQAGSVNGPVVGGTNPARRLPSDDRERAVLAAMEELLHLPGLGVDDDFFAVGGHSLLAARLATRLAGIFDVRLPMRTVFEARTATRLAQALRAASGASAPRRARIRHEPGRSVAALTPGQDRILRMEAMAPGRSLYNTPSAHRLRGPLDVTALHGALADLIERQPSLRTSFGPVPGRVGTQQRIAAEVSFSVPMIDLRELPASDREAVLMQRLQQAADEPIDTSVAPLVRMCLYRLADDDHVLLFTPHHLVWDGWSFDVFYDEMAAAYAARTSGNSADLATHDSATAHRSTRIPAGPHHGRAPLPASPADWAEWLADWMHGDECASQVAWWRQQYAEAPATRAPATDRPRRAGMTGRGATAWIHLDRARADAIHALARRLDVTPSAVLLAAYAALLAQTFGHPHWVIGVPARGRLEPELEALTGFFNNLLPLHLSVDCHTAHDTGHGACSDAAASAVVMAVHQRAMDALSHQDTPFERWATEPDVAARAQRDGGLYQTLFSFQDARARTRRWGALEQTNVLLHPKVATEDLGLWLMEVPSGMEGGFTFNADLYRPSTAQALRRRYQELLDRLLAAPDARCADWLSPEGSDAALALLHLASGQTGGSPALPDVPAAEAVADAVGIDPPMPTGSAGVPSQQTTIAAVAAIWSDLLGVPAEQILPRDNFFDLGGQSLLAVAAASRIEARFALAFDTRRLIFESLGQIAATLGGEGAAAAAPPMPAAGAPAAPTPASEQRWWQRWRTRPGT